MKIKIKWRERGVEVPVDSSMESARPTEAPLTRCTGSSFREVDGFFFFFELSAKDNS
jgi:hypothetical protein